jgi:receptor protein-tyrosine kinase
MTLEDDLLDLLEPTLRRRQTLCRLSYLVRVSVWMAVDDQTTRLGAIHVESLGLGVAFLLERFDRRIRERRDVEGIYGLPLLGVVPESAALSRSGSGKKGVREVLPAGEAEAFHLIRAHLRYFNVDRELRTLLVASAAPGDGKTTVARHLASAAAIERLF